MKIVHITAYFPPHVGGQETVVKQITEHLSEKGHEVEVITSDFISNGKKLPNTKNLNIHYCKAVEFGHSTIIFSLFFRLLLLSKKDLVHVHVSNAFVPEIVYLASLIKRYKYIAHIHIDTEPSSKIGLLLPLYKKYILSHVLKKAYSLIVPTKDYVSIIQKKYSLPVSKIHIVPNGINLDEFMQAQGSLHSPVRLLFVGRLSKQKNIYVLIRAVQELIYKDNNLILQIVGDGEEKDMLIQKVQELDLGENIIFKGQLTGEELKKIYMDSDIFILPSTYESFGVVILEAMASNLPIIASNITAVKDIINNKYNGILIEPTSPNIAHAIATIINNKGLRTELINNASTEVRKYSWDKIIPLIESLYKNSME